MTDIIVAVIGAAGLAVVAVIEGIAARERRRDKEARARTEARAALRAEESRLSMQMMDAAIELGIATALAVEQHKLNGEMKKAKANAAKVRDKYRAYVQDVASDRIAKV